MNGCSGTPRTTGSTGCSDGGSWFRSAWAIGPSQTTDGMDRGTPCSHTIRVLSQCRWEFGCRRRVTSTSRQRNLATSIRLSHHVGGSRFRLRRGAHLALGPRIPGAMSLSLTRSPWCGCGSPTTGRRRVKTLLQLPVLRFWPATLASLEPWHRQVESRTAQCSGIDVSFVM